MLAEEDNPIYFLFSSIFNRFLKIFYFCCFTYFTILQSQTSSDAIRLFENEKGFGTYAIGLGSAYSGLSNDYSSIYWNPAGLSSIKKSTLSIEFNNNYFKNNTNFLNNTFNNSINDNYLNSLGGTYSVPTTRGSLVFAFAFNNIGDYNYKSNFSGFSNNDNNLFFPIIISNEEVNYFFNQNVFREEKISSTGKISQISFGFGILISKKTSFGLSINSINNQENYSFQFDQNDLNDNFNIFPADFLSYSLNQSLELRARGNKITFGFLTKLTSHLNTGFSINLPFNYDVNEKHISKEILTFDDNSFSDTTLVGNYNYIVKAPYNLDYGISFKMKSLLFSSSIKIQNWSNIRLKDKSKSENNYIEENLAISNNYQSTLQLNLGMSYEFKFNNFIANLILGHSTIPSFYKFDNSKKQNSISSGFSLNFKNDLIINFSTNNTNWELFTTDSYMPSGTIESIDKTIHSISLIVEI